SCVACTSSRIRFRPRLTISPASSTTTAPTGIVPTAYASHMRSKTSGQGASRSASALIPRRAEREPRDPADGPVPLVGGELLEGREQPGELRRLPLLLASHPRHGRHGFCIGTRAPPCESRIPRRHNRRK